MATLITRSTHANVFRCYSTVGKSYNNHGDLIFIVLATNNCGACHLTCGRLKTCHLLLNYEIGDQKSEITRWHVSQLHKIWHFHRTIYCCCYYCCWMFSRPLIKSATKFHIFLMSHNHSSIHHVSDEWLKP